jgi:hypothetical protein
MAWEKVLKFSALVYLPYKFTINGTVQNFCPLQIFANSFRGWGCGDEEIRGI